MTDDREDRQSAGPVEHHSAVLEHGLQAAGAARRLVAAVLLRWELHALLDVLLLVVSELVTNAVRHGRPPVHLTVSRTPAELRLRVRDASSAEPVHPAGERLDLEAETGRGVDIVTALADEFGWEQIDGGKVVYASFRRPDPPD